jgi:hypothetical protein
MLSRRNLIGRGAASLSALIGTGQPALADTDNDQWIVRLPPGVTPAPARERLVAVSYSNWFHDKQTDWNNEWGIPKLGYYQSTDRSVIRQHGLWLAEAGVDFILLDESNDLGADWLHHTGDPRSLARLEATAALFDEWSSMERAPKISIFLGGNPPNVFDNGRLRRKADEIHELFVSNSRYTQRIQTYMGKPLLVIFIGPSSTGRLAGSRDGWPNGTPSWDDPRFTVRFMGGFVTDQPNLMGPNNVSRYGYWSWEDRGPPSIPIYLGHPEAVTIVAAWAGESRIHPPQGRDNGKTFRRDWQYARRIGPRIALVTTFNEWWRGEQHNAELSRDIEPSQEFGNLYLDMVKEQGGLFKAGV